MKRTVEIGVMGSIVICAFLLAKVTLVDACASGQFTESGQCCSLCPAGYEVEVMCGKENSKCRPCPQGKFSSFESLDPCLPCSHCPPSIPTFSSCSASRDTECECDTGYFFMRTYGVCVPCSKCSRGEGVIRECGPQGDRRCQSCGPGTFSEDHSGTKPCQICTLCSNNEVEIRSCMPASDTLCMDKRLHIKSLPTDVDGSMGTLNWPVLEEGEQHEEEAEGAPGPSRFPPKEESGSNNVFSYVSVLAAVVLGLIIYVAYKCWRSCKQKKALSKARAAELGTSPEGEKLQSDSGVFLDSYSLHDNHPSKGTKQNSKYDNCLYINLPPHRQEEVERLLQEGSGHGWKHLGATLGYDPDQLDLFERGEAPAHTLLSNWAQKEGSSLGLLCSSLTRIDRPDVVLALNSALQGASEV